MSNRTRNPAPLSPAEWARLKGAVAEHLGAARARSTWQVLASVWNQFTHWDAVQSKKQLDYATLPIDERMITWHVWKLERGDIKHSTPVKYAKILIQLHRAMFHGEHSSTLSEYKRALVRQGYNIPDGSPAITLDQMKEAMSSCEEPSLRFQVFAMWMLASRNDDVNRLKRKHINLEAPRLFSVKWEAGTKGGPHQITDFLRVPNEVLAGWTHYLDSLSEEAHPFPHDHRTITQVLRTIDPGLSSHSLKKGALTFLASRNIPIHMLAAKAKHQSLENLRVYIGERAWAIAHGAQAMAEELDMGMQDTMTGQL